MKPEQLEQWILLRESGELSEADARTLSEHLADDPALAAYAADTQVLMDAAQDGLEVDGPGPECMASLKTKAFGATDLRPRPYARRVMRVLSYAAVLALALGLWRFHSHADLTDRVGALNAILSLTDTEQSTSLEDAGDSHEERLDALAQMLLEMEGLGMEDDSWEDDAVDFDSLIPQEERPPTALQWNSSPGFPDQKYG